MKRVLFITFIVIYLCLSGSSAFAQPDPNNGGGGGTVGGSAPLGGGLITLICCGISYVLFKTYKYNKRH